MSDLYKTIINLQDGKNIGNIINEEKIHVYTGHCTGSVAFAMLKKYCPEYIHDLYSGKVIEF